MAKYKLLNTKGYSSSHFTHMNVYDENYMGMQYSVKDLVKNYPNDWELIKEEPMSTEKTITLSLDKARKMYGKNPEMDELLLANFSKEELTKKELPKSWAELKTTPGYYITNRAEIDNCGDIGRYRNMFATEKQAKSALAMAQLSQLMAVYNGDWIPYWGLADQSKWCIAMFNDKLESTSTKTLAYHFLAFKSAELRDEFLKNFESLIKEYFMID